MSLIYLSHPPPSEEGETGSEAEGVGTYSRRHSSTLMPLNQEQVLIVTVCSSTWLLSWV